MAQVPSLTPQVAHSTASAAAVNTSLEALRTGINNIDSSQLDPDSVGSSEIAAGAVTPAEVSIWPAARVTRTANQTIAASTFTAIQFDAETFDTATMHDNATNNSRVVMPTAGVYQINVLADYAPSGSAFTTWTLALQINGSQNVAVRSALVGTDNATVYPSTMSLSAHWSAAANDYVQAIVFCATAGAVSRTAVQSPFLSVVYQTRAS